jgi:hypothetical protein
MSTHRFAEAGKTIGSVVALGLTFAATHAGWRAARRARVRLNH